MLRNWIIEKRLSSRRKLNIYILVFLVQEVVNAIKAASIAIVLHTYIVHNN